MARVPEVLPPYRILTPLQHGGMSQVFLAERIRDFEQKVVIKFCTGLSYSDASREAEILGRLKHENIVQLIGSGTSDFADYLVLEYIDGVPIDDFFESNGSSLDERLEVLDQVMAGISYAHRHLQIHADIKASNVLVTKDNGVIRAKILDFGNSRSLTENPVRDAVAYSPLYASPEQREGKPVTILTDVFSLGGLCSITLKKWLRGDLQAVVAKATQLQPEARYVSVEALRHDLARVRRGEATSARPISGIAAAARWARRRPLFAAAVAILVCTILISAGEIVVHDARVVKQRRLADNQLREVIELTGVLEDQLYGALRSLDGSGSARQELRGTTLNTLNSIAPEANEPLRIELAKQYARLAQLELAEAPAPNARRRALAETQQGLTLLGQDNEPAARDIREQLVMVSRRAQGRDR